MKKILAIDDQLDNLTTIKAVIKSYLPEFIVLTALSGAEGIKAACAEQPDTILLDILMPGMDGFEVCRILKQNELTRHIPVIMVTAIHTDSESRIRGLELGADAFLSKPYDLPELVAVINVMLRIKASEDKLRSEKANIEQLIQVRTSELIQANLKLEYEITERKNAEKIQQVLYNVSNAVSNTRDVEDLIKIIGKELGVLVDTTNFYIAFYDEATGMFSSPYLQDEKDDLNSWPAAKSMTGLVVLQDRSVLITPTERKEVLGSGAVEIIGVPAACWLGVPLHIDGRVFGAFVVQSYDNPHAYSEEDMEILEFVSEQVGLSIQRKRIEQDLIAAKEKAQFSDRLKSSFLANMSHEIRTPMNAIVGFASMISDPDLSEEDRNKFSAIIQSRSNDLMHIISDLLEISRIESGNATVIRQTVSMNAVIDELESVFSERIERNKKTNITLLPERDFTRKNLDIISDGYILKQVFSNLIDNAIKFTDSGTIRFGYNALEDGKVTCYVSDTGIGISKENLSLIFEYFRQADTHDKHKYGGTGLGLAICKGLLDLLGGEIWLESEPGKGSTFYFSFPFDAEPDLKLTGKINQGNNKKAGPHNWSDKKILLVEDEETNMQFLNIILKRTGASLVSAYSARELRKSFPQLETFDLVLLDIRLPDASGWDLAKEIKALQPGLPVIAQTAYAMSTDKQKSEKSGCDGYISKPINKDKLMALLTGYLEN